MKTIIFFNNRDRIGKTTLVYHIAYMLAELGHRCLAVDLDPQANLTSMFLGDEELERIYSTDIDRETLISGIKPLDRGVGDIARVKVHRIGNSIGLLAGDLDLSLFEDKLSANWSRCLDSDEAAFRITSSFYRIMQQEGRDFEAEYCIIDAGPNFGAINRAVLISADYVVVPIAADLFSLQGLKNSGNRLNEWRAEWSYRLRRTAAGIDLPVGKMQALGYVMMQHGVRASRPIQFYLKRANELLPAFSDVIIARDAATITTEDDSYCLALLKHYHSLVPMAMEARKPIFLLKPADGAIGAHYQAVGRSYTDFKLLTEKIMKLAK